MEHQQQIERILTEILSLALLRIRALGWHGEAQRCAVEADHVHNLPHLLQNFNPDLVDYYWRVERPCFMRDCTWGYEQFPKLWDELETLLSARD